MPSPTATISGRIIYVHNNSPAGNVNLTAWSYPQSPYMPQDTLNSTLTNPDGTYSLFVNTSTQFEPFRPFTMFAKVYAADGNITFVTPALPPAPPTDKSNVTLYLSPVVTVRVSPTFNGVPIGTGQYKNCSFDGVVMDQQVAIPYEFFRNKTQPYDIVLPQDRNYSIVLMTPPPMPGVCDMGSPPKQINNAGGTGGLFTNTSAANPSDLAQPTVRKLYPEMNFTRVVLTGYFKINGTEDVLTPNITFQNPLIYIEIMQRANYRFLPPDARFPFKALNSTDDFVNATTGEFRITLTSGSNYIVGGFANNNSNLSWGGYENFTNLGGDIQKNVTLYPFTGKRHNGNAVTNPLPGPDFMAADDVTTNQITINVTSDVGGIAGSTAIMNAPLNLYVAYPNGMKIQWLLTGGRGSGEKSFSVPAGTGITLEAFNPGFAPIKLVYNSTQIQTYVDSNNSVIPVQMKRFDVRKPRRMPGNASEVMNLTSQVRMQFLRSNATCSVPNAPPSCNIGSGVDDARSFDPTNSMMLGKTDILMTQSTPRGNVTIKYVGASLMSTAPPDAQYMDTPIAQSGDGRRETWRFGSSAPKIYDYALVAMPYNSSRINENMQMRARIPLLYDQNGNVIYNRTDPTKNATPEEYQDYDQRWFNGSDVICSPADQAGLCYQDKDTDTIWMKMLHFSEVGPESEATTNVVACGDLTAANTIYNLTQNVNSSGTCFNVLANNVTLRGNGYLLNYSQSSGGHAINNTGGYGYLTIRDLNVVQGGANPSESAIYGFAMANSTILNNNITTTTDYGIHLLMSSNSNTLSGNTIITPGWGILVEDSRSNALSNNNITITGNSGVGMFLDVSSASNTISWNFISTFGDATIGILVGDSNSNVLSNNAITATGPNSIGVYLESSNASSLSNNTIATSGAGTFGLWLMSSASNTVSGGSITSQSGHAYYLQNAGSANNFTDTNFTAQRKILLNNSYFNYRDSPYSSIWLSTNISAAGNITRQVSAWGSSLVRWNDTNLTSMYTTYTLTGLQPSTSYNLYNKSGGAQTTIPLATDAGGSISFTIRLNGNTELRVQTYTLPGITIQSPANNSLYGTTAVTLNYTAYAVSGISQCKYELTNSSGPSMVPLPTCANATLAGVTEGVNSVRVWANDSDGNANYSSPVFFTVDTIAPSIAISNPYDGQTTNSLLLNFTATDAQSTALYCNNTLNGVNATIGTVQNATAKTTTLNLTAAQEGTNSLTVMCADQAGNSNTSTLTFTRDSTGPTVAINAPAIGYNTSLSILLVNYTAIDALSTALNCTTYLDGIANNTNTSVANNTPFTHTINGLGELNHAINVTCTDTLGNAGSSQRTFNVDQTKPSIYMALPANGGIYSSVAINFTATDNLGSTLSCNKTVNGGTFTIGAVTKDVANVTAQSWSEGTNYVNVTCADSVGNVNTSATTTFTYDTTPPAISLISPASGFNTSSPSVFVNASTIDALSPALNCSIKIDGASAWNNATWQNGTNIQKDITISEGTHYVNATCTDLAGNQNTTATSTITVDLTPPTIARIYSLPARAYNNTNLTLIVNATDSATAVTNVTANITKPSFETELVALSLIGGYAWNGTILVDQPGPYHVAINATDAVGRSTIKGFDFSAGVNTTIRYNTTNSTGGTPRVNVTIIAPDNDGIMNSSGSKNDTLSIPTGAVIIRLTDTDTNVTIDLPVNVTGEISFNPVLQAENKSMVAAPPTSNTPLLVQTITPNVTFYSAATLKFSYAGMGISASEAYRLRVHKCTSYNSTSGACSGPSWTELASSVDNTTQTVTAFVDSFSTFMLANKTSVCGNSIPETGEECDAGPSGSFTCTSICTTIASGCSGCGSGGGSTGSSTSAPPSTVKETRTISSVAPGAAATITISKAELPVSQITIESLVKAANVSVTVEKLDSKPATITALPTTTGRIYKYLEISSSIASANLSKAKIKFRVETKWIASNNYSASTVSLSRYSKGWSRLPTTFLSSDSNNSYFEAESPGFSTFAITGERYTPPPPAPVEQPKPPETPVEAPTPVEPTPTALTPIAALITQSDIDSATRALDAANPQTEDARKLIAQARAKIAEAQAAFNGNEQARAKQLLDDARLTAQEAAGLKSVAVSKGKTSIYTILLLAVILIAGAYAYYQRPQTKDTASKLSKLKEEKDTILAMKKNAEKEYLLRKTDKDTYHNMLADYESRLVEVNTRIERLEQEGK